MTYGDAPTDWAFWKAVGTYPVDDMPLTIGHTYDTLGKLEKAKMGSPGRLAR